MEELLGRIPALLCLWVSLSVHEWAHAYSAYRLGDDTAARLGRMTINPIAHIDPIGTLLLPLLGVPFGWAKPVPINPLGFRPDVKISTGVWVTASAGPVSNVVLAVGFIFILALGIRFLPDFDPQSSASANAIWYMVRINVLLAVFNALPIPPLDGSRVVEALLPTAFRPAWHTFVRFGPIALLMVLFLPITQPLFHVVFRGVFWLLGVLLNLFGAPTAA